MFGFFKNTIFLKHESHLVKLKNIFFYMNPIKKSVPALCQTRPRPLYRVYYNKTHAYKCWCLRHMELTKRVIYIYINTQLTMLPLLAFVYLYVYMCMYACTFIARLKPLLIGPSHVTPCIVDVTLWVRFKCTWWSSQNKRKPTCLEGRCCPCPILKRILGFNAFAH
jgi:hypothetical protein